MNHTHVKCMFDLRFSFPETACNLQRSPNLSLTAKGGGLAQTPINI